ncbi:polysaccharide deacetylase family protein [Pseudodesulfovibrio sp.]|uniref:polysaccharide deacetylase family protein n=1 Tax=Pseudodesulfovibrio sp. TaxID=2035812 RepID=UPI00263A0F0B|nr:polysaccharide deacetylase family protein [Pseudodesulfovibrio sp.]MDD3312521.1 polysaccharide deacetylase family protein [Pseudodesulfovibrio sp.]
MTSLRACLLGLLTILIFVSGCGSAPAPADEETFGSDKLLHGLWFDGQLAGADSDTARAVLPEPDLRPPLRTMPLRALPPVPPELQRIITSVEPRGGRKVVALTFDLCERAPHLAGYRREIFNFLRANGVKASFFAGGKWMRSHPEKAMQLMADPLFELGNHAWTHGNLALMDEAEVRRQVDWTQAEYELLYEELGYRARQRGLGAEMVRVPPSLGLMRLPYGRNNAQTAPLLASMGLPLIQWSIEGERDELDHTVDELVAWNLKNVKPGAIILMHANAVPHKTHLLVPRLVAALRERGYGFVTVSELLRFGPAVTVDEGYFTMPGDNLYLDHLFGGKGTLGRVR